MNHGPRIYNSMVRRARARLKRKQAKKKKKCIVRLNRIIVAFAIIFVVLGVQIALRFQTGRINNQVEAEKQTLAQGS